jgi:hypothetical protein
MPGPRLFHKFKQKSYELGLQMRTDVAEAAFSPPQDAATGKKGRQNYSILTGGFDRQCPACDV